MKDKSTKSNGKKPIFKKWWFWVIIVVILAAIFGNSGTNDSVKDETKDAINSTEQQATSDKFVEDVKTAISGAIDSDNEAITDIALKDKDLCVTVDLSKADPSPLTIEDLAISRTSSITDAILELTGYDSQWNTITVDFGDVGKVVCDKDSIKENEAGGRYFPSENSHWKVARWATGCTAGGSSGSPLFDSDNRIIGGLTGGASSCLNPVEDFFFSIQKSWSEPADSSKQLKYWLDPIGVTARSCNGMDPNEGSGTANEHIEAATDVSLSVDRYRHTIHIDFAVPVSRASLTFVSPTGKAIRNYSITGQQTTLPIGSIPAGIYIVKIVYNNKLYTQKALF